MANADSSSSSSPPPPPGDASSEPLAVAAVATASSSSSSLPSIADIRSAARSAQQTSSTHLRTFQNYLPEAVSQYRTYEDAFLSKVKDGMVVARENPALGAGLAISAALIAMRAPRRFLYRHTFGRFQSEEARYASAEKSVKDLNQSLELMRNESKKLLERTTLAEKDMKYGYNELMSTGTKCKKLAKSLYKVEARAADLMDRLREVPTRESLALRADVASMVSTLKRQRSALDKRILKISELGLAV
ncbi:hypothetical protein TanjilG_09382 [Lupinus angustifolius]|uniref:Uncharacterized protein n=1 Tax=Lupinus angustifolius TaxID=3871 RepID=A0A1J7G1A9_LUPAN|nr:PREDICTED: uncharacterized protein LOC109331935 [Lupinus angustifolius]OIV94227.1 hypothetical protein TanjilG_09382 [Lupinus angustifolius]